MAASGIAQASAETKLRITIPVKALIYYPVIAATDLGYFKDEGIDMSVVTVGGDGPDVDALIAGSVQFSATTPNRLLSAYSGGKTLLGVMSLTNRIGINCFMNKERADQLGITETTPIDDKLGKLKGLVLGGTRPGAFTNLLAESYLKRTGLTPQKDAKVIGVGAGAAMMAATENKQIDVGCIASPTPEIAVSRGKSIMFMNNTQGDDPKYREFLFAMLYVRPDFAKTNEDDVRKVVRALQRALVYVKTTPFEKQLPDLQRQFGELDPAILKASLDNTQASIEPSGTISHRAYDAALEFMLATGVIDKPVPYEAVISGAYLPK
ncbi:ABC transporter substrate-binding protein [Tardiphaga sp. 866_E4_N2_1]|uniref:ABC transporter substrate-binding protein n=1 Tax=unclassified Tardiphaga TaxID=2631404 RepID=UPI003F22991E